MTLRCKPVTAKEGTPLIIRPVRPGIFFKVRIMSECIEWQNYRSEDGYGIQKYRGKTVKAHRLAYCQANGL